MTPSCTRRRSVRRTALPAATARPAAALLALLALLALAACGGKEGPSVAPSSGSDEPDAGGASPEALAAITSHYWLYVANEGSDVVSRLRFGPEGLVYEKAIPVGSVPGQAEGPVAVSVDAAHERWFLLTSRGRRTGRLWKYETGTDELLGRVELGPAPGALGLTPRGDLAFVVNTDSGGRRVPSTLSVVSTGEMREISRLATCREARASTVSPDGSRVYTVCRGDDMLLEVSTATRRVSRTLRLSAGDRCGPEAVVPDPRREVVYVSCGRDDRILVVGTDDLSVTDRLNVGAAPRGIAVTPDGRWLLVTLSGGGSVALVDLASGSVAERIPTSRSSPYGVAATSDGRFAFVTSRGPETVRGAVDVVDLEARRRIASVAVEDGPAGLALWRALPLGGG